MSPHNSLASYFQTKQLKVGYPPTDWGPPGKPVMVTRPGTPASAGQDPVVVLDRKLAVTVRVGSLRVGRDPGGFGNKSVDDVGATLVRGAQ